MNRIPVFICLFFLNAQLLSGATVSLSGTVKNSTGSAISGATVSLVKMRSLSATTDAQGVFALSGTGVSRLPSAEKSRFQCSLSGNNLVISPVFENINGGIEVFSGNGRKTVSILFSGTVAGTQSVKLPGFMPGLNIVRVTVGDESVTQSFIRLGESNRYLKNGAFSVNAAGRFMLSGQTAAAVDTLIASRSGYTDAKVPVDSYERQNIAIVMQDAAPDTGMLPLVYSKEWMGADCPKPALVADPTTLPAISTLPDPFLMSDGKTRMTARAQWICRRAEIKAMIEKYETGEKPGKPGTFSAKLNGNKIAITCGENGKTFTMNATISRPSGAPDTPIPAIINKGSLSFNFAAKNIATISWNEGDVVSQSGARTSGNFYSIYPSTASGGHFIRWAWGVSRIIDALEALPEAKIDLQHIAVSGCSYQGKQALYSGAFDERIALTIVHESGGGGTMCWRYGDFCADRDKVEVENLHVAQGCNWYAEVLGKYKPTGVSPNTLPFDQHELIGMIAPRAVLCLESTLIARMGAEAAHMSAVGARRIYTALGIPDRIGVSESNVNHCSWDAGYTTELAAYVDKFLLGKDAKTGNVESKFTSIDTVKWIPWETPVLK